MKKSWVRFQITDDDDKMVDFLKSIVKSTTRSKVFRFCLKKTYEVYKEI